MEETFLLNFYNGIHFIMEGEGLLKRFFFVVGIYYLWKMSFEKHRNWISDETLSALKYSIFLVLFTCCVALSKFNPLCVHCITDEMASPRFSTSLQVYFLTWISAFPEKIPFISIIPTRCQSCGQSSSILGSLIARVFKRSSFVSRWIVNSI